MVKRDQKAVTRAKHAARLFVAAEQKSSQNKGALPPSLSSYARNHRVTYNALYFQVQKLYKELRDVEPDPTPTPSKYDMVKAAFIGSLVAMQVRGNHRTLGDDVPREDMTDYIHHAMDTWEVFVEALGDI